MKIVWRSVLAGGVAAALIGMAATARPSWNWQGGRDFLTADLSAQARAVIARWPSSSALAARVMTEEYGTPDDVSSERLIWSYSGPWLRTVVHKEARPPFFSQEVLEQTVLFEIPGERVSALADFGHGVGFDPRSNELTARSAGEETNFLAVNLAVDIARGRVSLEEAEQLYAKFLVESMAGKSLPSMRGLLFSPSPAAPARDWRRYRRW